MSVPTGRTAGEGLDVSVIEVEALAKTYDGINVVDGVSFEVEEGVCGR